MPLVRDALNTAEGDTCWIDGVSVTRMDSWSAMKRRLSSDVTES